MKLLIFEDIGQYFLGHLIRKAPLSTKDKEGGLDPKSSLRAGLWEARSPATVTRKWVGKTGSIKLVLRIDTSQSHVNRKECVQEHTRGLEGLCQKPSANFSLHLSDHLCVRCWFMNKSLSLELGVKHVSCVRERWIPEIKNHCFVRKEWKMGTGQETHSVHELIFRAVLVLHSTASALACLRFFSVHWQWPTPD